MGLQIIILCFIYKILADKADYTNSCDLLQIKLPLNPEKIKGMKKVLFVVLMVVSCMQLGAQTHRDSVINQAQKKAEEV